MKYIHFFGLKEDLFGVLGFVESKGPLQYTLTGNFLASELKDGPKVIKCGIDIPNLGNATADSVNGCDTYLVSEPSTPIKLGHIQVIGGVERVCIDQLENPDTVAFTAGGIWNEDVVLNGRIATVSETVAAQGIMKRFHSAIRKTFARVRAFYVGPKALVLLDSGKRLTGALQCPHEYDLAR
jgi:hypothetical protein